MSLSTSQILSFLSLKGIGPKAVQILNSYVVDNTVSLSSADDMLDLINYCISNKIIPRIKNTFEVWDIDAAISYSSRILEESEKLGIHSIGYNDDLFPNALRSIVDAKGKCNAPLILYVKGNVDVLNMKRAIAIIGTREPTNAGVKAGLFFSEQFAKANFNIVSGLALGCDTTAHKGALKAGGITTAFVASGLDLPIYPSENKNLAEDIIANNGALISEYPLGTVAMANRFVERDRLQSGLSQATLAIQTGVKGGTLHAVNATLDNHKPLYMVQFKGDELLHDKVQGNQLFLSTKKANPISTENYQDIILSLCSDNLNSCSSQPSLFDCL